MSEANNHWSVTVDGAEHAVDFELTMLGKWTVTVDGAVVVEDRQWTFSKEESFPVGSATARIKVGPEYGGLAYSSELTLDGAYVEPLHR